MFANTELEISTADEYKNKNLKAIMAQFASFDDWNDYGKNDSIVAI